MVSLKINEILLLISLLNAIEAYSNDTTYSRLYSSEIEIGTSYLTSTAFNSRSSNNENSITSSPETTTLAGQYSESARVAVNEEQSTGTPHQYSGALTTSQDADSTLSTQRPTEKAIPSSSEVPTPTNYYSGTSLVSQTLDDNSMSILESSNGVTSSGFLTGIIISTSDGTAVPGKINPTLSSLSKEESTSSQAFSYNDADTTTEMISGVSWLSSAATATRTDSFTSGLVRTEFTSALSRISQPSSIKPTTLMDSFSMGSVQTQLADTISSEVPTEEEYIISELEISENYDSSLAIYLSAALIAEKKSSSLIINLLSSYSKPISTQTFLASHTGNRILTASTVSHPSSLTSTTLVDSVISGSPQTQLINVISISSKVSTEEYTVSDLEFPINYGSSAGNYPDQELIVNPPYTYSTNKASSLITQSTRIESNPIMESSISTTKILFSSISHTKTSTSTFKTMSFASIHSFSSVPSPLDSVAVSSSRTSFPNGIAPSSSLASVVVPSSHTSSPNEVSSSPPTSAAISSTYPSSSNGVASSPPNSAAISSTYLSSQNRFPPSSPLASVVVPSSHTSSPNEVSSSPPTSAAISSTYPSSPNGVASSPPNSAAISSTYLSSQNRFPPSSPLASVVVPSSRTSSPNEVSSSPPTSAAISSTYLSSPNGVAPPSPLASVVVPSSRTSSPNEVSSSPLASAAVPSAYISLSSDYTLEFSSVDYSTTSVVPAIPVHSPSLGITNSLQQTSLAIQNIVSEFTSASSTFSQETYPSAISVISMSSSTSNLFETSQMFLSTQLTPTYNTNLLASSTPRRLISTNAKASYEVTTQNIESSSTSTMVSNFPYFSSSADKEKFSTIPKMTMVISSGIQAHSIYASSSHHSSTGISIGVLDSSKTSGLFASSLDHATPSTSSANHPEKTASTGKSASSTQKSSNSIKFTSQPNSQFRNSEVRSTLSTGSNAHFSFTSSLPANSKVNSENSSKKGKTITDNDEKTSSATRKTQNSGLSKTSESYSRPSTKISTRAITTAVQTQVISNLESPTPVLSIYSTNLDSSSNSYAWLPTAIIVESSETDTSTTLFNPTITGSLPNLIEPAVTASEPINHTLITVGFTAALNYVFLVQNPLSSAQIFNFLPLVLKYPFSDTSSRVESSNGELSSFILSYRSGTSTTTLSPQSKSSLSIVRKKKKGDKEKPPTSTMDLYFPSINASSIAVKQIVPMMDSSKAYIIAVAEVYFPTEAVSYLQELILDVNSTLYNNPQSPLRTLADLIDNSIPLGSLTLYSSGNEGHVSSLFPSGVLDSSKENSKGIVATYKYGALDDFTNSFTDSAPGWSYAARTIVFLAILTIGALLWLLFAFFVFHYRNILLKRYPKDCIEKSLGNERKFDSTALSRSSSGNQIFNEKPSGSENESVHSVTDDHYIITGENTVYSTTHGLHYTINDNGDLFYKEATLNDLEETAEREDSGIDSILRDCVYDEHQESTEAYLNDEESISSIVDVDENGNIRLYDSYSDDEEPNSFHLPNEVIEEYNNNNVYKIKHNTPETGSCTTDDPEAGNMITNEFSSSSQTCLPSTTYTTPLHTNSIKLQTLRYSEISLSQPNKALFSNHEDLEIDDIDDNGSVSDIQIEELDALDEELYKRISKIAKQQNL